MSGEGGGECAALLHGASANLIGVAQHRGARAAELGGSLSNRLARRFDWNATGTMIVKINPAWIPGRWRLGVSLDVHTVTSEFLGYDDDGRPQFNTTRSEIGELLYRLKYMADGRAVDPIADTASSYLRQLSEPPFKVAPTLIIPVPPSRQRPRQPLFELARAIGAQLGVPVVTNAILASKTVPELKSVHDYTTRLDLLRDAYRVDPAKTAGASLLLLDDLFRSGATLNAVANILVDSGGARDLCALTITRTRSHR